VLAIIVVKGNKTSNLRGFKLSQECGAVVRGSAVSIATRYELDGPGIESRWGARFSAPVQSGPEVRPTCYTMGIGFLSRGVKRGRDFDHPHPSSTKVKEKVELHFYSPSGPSWPVLS
jgi:hypothetical protein